MKSSRANNRMSWHSTTEAAATVGGYTIYMYSSATMHTMVAKARSPHIRDLRECVCDESVSRSHFRSPEPAEHVSCHTPASRVGKQCYDVRN